MSSIAAFQQVPAPLGSLALSALVALLPLVTIFVLLGVLKWKAHFAALGSLAVAIVVAVFFGMSPGLALLPTTEGAVFGLFPIMWIVFTAIWLYQVTVVSGRFEDLRGAFHLISDDPRVQAIIIAFWPTPHRWRSARSAPRSSPPAPSPASRTPRSAPTSGGRPRCWPSGCRCCWCSWSTGGAACDRPGRWRCRSASRSPPYLLIIAVFSLAKLWTPLKDFVGARDVKIGWPGLDGNVLSAAGKPGDLHRLHVPPITIGVWIAGTGAAFAYLSSIVGWLGTAVTGSDTSSNALFATLQQTAAQQAGLDPTLLVAANTSGGVVGKMISRRT